MPKPVILGLGPNYLDVVEVADFPPILCNCWRAGMEAKGGWRVRVRTQAGDNVSCVTARPRLNFNILRLNFYPIASRAMTSEQAAQLIDSALDLVHQRLQNLEAQAMTMEHKALTEEFREWRQPIGGHIDLMVFPGLTNS